MKVIGTIIHDELSWVGKVFGLIAGLLAMTTSDDHTIMRASAVEPLGASSRMPCFKLVVTALITIYSPGCCSDPPVSYP